PDHIVVLVHGIRDHALWEQGIRKSLSEAGLASASTSYGRFDLIRFVLPIPYFRNWAIENVWDQVRAVRAQHPDAKLSFIAHSFGTYIVANMLSRDVTLKADKVIL